MNRFLLFALAALVCGLTHAQEPYQVPGFPPFDPAPPILEVIEDRGATVLVRHGYREIEVPKSPQRIFANVGLEVALPLELSVVGGTFAGGSFKEMPPTLQAATRNITMFDAYAEPNLEAILSLQPDLIIDWRYEADPMRYEQFSRIAPTLSLLANSVYDWKQATRDMAAVFGLEARAEEVIRQYEAKVTEQCERIRSHVGEETLSIIRMQEREVTLDGPGTYGVFSDERYTPWIITAWAYRDCRLTPGPEVARLLGTEPRTNLSLELLSDIQAEHLVVLLDVNNATADAFMGSRLWQSIPAVQKGRVHPLESTWGLGYYTDPYTLKRVADALTSNSPERSEQRGVSPSRLWAACSASPPLNSSRCWRRPPPIGRFGTLRARLASPPRRSVSSSPSPISPNTWACSGSTSAA